MAFRKSILSLISALLIVSFISFASAVSISSISYASSAQHDSDVTINFNVTYAGSQSTVNITFNESTTNIGTWKTLPANTAIANNSVPVSFSAVLNIPKYASGIVGATLKVKNLNTPTDTDTEPVTITITSSFSLSVSSVQPLSKTQNATINVTNTGNTALSNIQLSATGDINASFSANNFALSSGSSMIVNVDSLTSLGSLELGKSSLNILARDISTNASATLTYTVSTDFCDNGNVNASNVDITDISDKSSDTDDEWEWKPLDNIEIEFEVGNDLNKDEDFVAELALFDSEKNNFVELDGENSLEQDIAIDEGDIEKVTFEFQVPADIEDSDGRYVLYVKAYVDGDEDIYCNSYDARDAPTSSVDSIQISKKNNDVVIDEISATDVVRPGDTVTVSARAFNIGNNDEDKVKVTLSNSKLVLDLESSEFSLDSGDSRLVDFSFVIPDNAESGIYSLRLVSDFSYKKSSDSYSKNSDIFEVKINVVGGKNTTTTNALSDITASLVSEAKAGSQMEITTTIRNLGTSSATFIVGVTDYESWASLNSISDRIITLDAGESKEITIEFEVNKDAKGEQTFTIESRSGDKIDSKEVAVEIGGGSFFASLASSLGSNSILWIIGIINVILIILIIYIAIRLFKR